MTQGTKIEWEKKTIAEKKIVLPQGEIRTIIKLNNCDEHKHWHKREDHDAGGLKRERYFSLKENVKLGL